MKRSDHLQTAAEIMTTDVVTLAPDTSIIDAAHRLLAEGCSGAPVVDDDGALVGMFTEQDCLYALAAAAYHNQPRDQVGDHMRRDVFSIPPTTDMFRLTYLLHDKPYRRVPVIDDDGRLVGLVARRDVMRALEKAARERQQQLERGPSTYEAIAEHRDQS